MSDRRTVLAKELYAPHEGLYAPHEQAYGLRWEELFPSTQANYLMAADKLLALLDAERRERQSGRTHWEGCWRDHLDCAVAEVERLTAAPTANPPAISSSLVVDAERPQEPSEEAVTAGAEENARLREGIKKHLHALARYGHHQYDRAASPCHYTPVKYDHAGTPQAGGNPCTCGLNEAMADFYALLSTSSEKGEQG